jgi:hypothetical protein
MTEGLCGELQFLPGLEHVEPTCEPRANCIRPELPRCAGRARRGLRALRTTGDTAASSGVSPASLNVLTQISRSFAFGPFKLIPARQLLLRVEHPAQRRHVDLEVFSSTLVSGHTSASRSLLVTTSPGRSTSAVSRSSAGRRCGRACRPIAPAMPPPPTRAGDEIDTDPSATPPRSPSSRYSPSIWSTLATRSPAPAKSVARRIASESPLASRETQHGRILRPLPVVDFEYQPHSS